MVAVASAATRIRARAALDSAAASAPPQAFFVASAIFHYLGPAFAVLLFARVDPLGVAWLRIASAGAIFAAWRRPWRALRGCGPEVRRLVVSLGVVLAVMNACFYVAIDRLPLGTVAAIEFLPVIVLAALGARSAPNLVALGLAVAGVYALVAGIGVGVASSVVPYVFDQLAMARLSRAGYSLMVALLPATATVIGVIVLAQIPTRAEVLGVALVVAAVALHREPDESA